MAKVYFLRHQAAGVLVEFPFAAQPSDKQTEAISKICFQRYGFGHAKTPEQPYWLRVVEHDVLDADTVPDVPVQGLSVVNEAALKGPTVSGIGHVTAGKGA